MVRFAGRRTVADSRETLLVEHERRPHFAARCDSSRSDRHGTSHRGCTQRAAVELVRRSRSGSNIAEHNRLAAEPSLARVPGHCGLHCSLDPGRPRGSLLLDVSRVAGISCSGLRRVHSHRVARRADSGAVVRRGCDGGRGALGHPGHRRLDLCVERRAPARRWPGRGTRLERRVSARPLTMGRRLVAGLRFLVRDTAPLHAVFVTARELCPLPDPP